jgi:ATP-dependent RNA helicase RhlE
LPPRSPTDPCEQLSCTRFLQAAGKAISLICPVDQHHFGIIQKKMAKKVEILESEDINLQGF